MKSLKTILLIFLIGSILALDTKKFEIAKVSYISSDFSDGILKGNIILPKESLRKIIRKRQSRRYGRRSVKLAKKAVKYNEYQKSMVYIIPLESKNRRSAKRADTLRQKNISFQPAHLVVQKGSVVWMKNEDNVFHNVFSKSKVKRFNIGKERKGEASPVRFGSVGHVRIFCDIHAFMNGIISVVDTPYFTTCDKKGNFEIRGIPEGRYKLYGWHPRSEYTFRYIDIQGKTITNVNDMEFK